MDRTQLPPCPKRIERGLPLLLAGLVAFGCGPAPVDSTARSPNLSGPRVVATYSILGDWVRQVGGERVQLTVLVGPGADAHTYEPTPRDVVAIAESEIVFENGLGFETWLDKLVASSGSNARRCVVGRVVQPRAIAANEIDPHVWQSPGNAVLMVEAIAEELASADPAHADQYRRRADEYVRSLESLEAEVREQARTLPPERRKLATTHDTFGYFADEYGFEVLSVLGSVTSEAADPSAGEVAATIARIRELRVPAIFSENILNPRLTEQIAREAGVKLVPSLYTDALGPADSPGADYLGMVRFNVRTIVEALR
jgi:zinc/manganese transport system substrate-binding protein